MAKYKLIAVDLDGTLLDSNKRVTEESKETLRKLHRKGIEIVLCSGRMLNSILPTAKFLNIECSIVAFNGARALTKIRKDGERTELFSDYLSKDLSREIIEFAKLGNHCVNFYADGIVYCICKNPQQEALIKDYAALTQAKYKFIEDYSDIIKTKESPKLAILVPRDELTAFYEKSIMHFSHKAHLIKGNFFVEFLNKGITKSTGLNYVLKNLKIDKSEVIGFGDGNNDKEFLQFVGNGIAMKNASTLCKESANRVSKWTNDENGVAKELNFIYD